MKREYAVLALIICVFAVLFALMFAFLPRFALPAHPDGGASGALSDGSAEYTGEVSADVSDTGSGVQSAPPDTADQTSADGGVTDALTTDAEPAVDVLLSGILCSGGITPSAESAKALADAIEAFGRPVGLVAVDTATGASVSFGADEAFAPASTIKAVLALYAAETVDSGEASLDEKLTYTDADRVYGNGVIGKMGVGTELTLREVLYHTLNTSDNEGYYMMLRRFGRSGCDRMTEALGCTTGKLSTSKWPKISARDLSLVWGEIYKRRGEGEGEKLIWDFLSDVEYMHFFRDALGSEGGRVLANKSGWNDDSCCEGGVIETDGGAYVLVILTKGSYYTANMDAFYEIVRRADAIMNEKR